MSKGDKYVRMVEWSENDKCFIGSCPALFYGGCHGAEAESVFAELCQIVEETVRLYEEDNKPLPPLCLGKSSLTRCRTSHDRCARVTGRGGA